MPSVKVFAEDEMKPLFVAEFAVAPRLGETISRETGDYFEYYKVVEVWHRQEAKHGKFSLCVRATLDD